MNMAFFLCDLRWIRLELGLPLREARPDLKVVPLPLQTNPSEGPCPLTIR